MSRPIEFRVWDKKEKLMVWPKEYPRDLYELCSGYGLTDRERFVFTQFTGLLDKNGNKIFEGDILKTECEPGYKEEEKIYVATFSYDLQFVAQAIDRIEENGNGLPLTWGGWESLEIIGNKFETPELLTTTE